MKGCCSVLVKESAKLTNPLGSNRHVSAIKTAIILENRHKRLVQRPSHTLALGKAISLLLLLLLLNPPNATATATVIAATMLPIVCFMLDLELSHPGIVLAKIINGGGGGSAPLFFSMWRPFCFFPEILN